MMTNVGSSYQPQPISTGGMSNAGSANDGEGEKRIIDKLTEPSGLTLTLRSDLLAEVKGNLGTYDVDVLCGEVLDKLKAKVRSEKIGTTILVIEKR